MASLFDISWITDKVKKGTVKYLIQRYLGHFLAKDLDTKLLDVDLASGTGSISDIQLNDERINSEIALYAPLKLMEGSVSNIQVQVPYKDIWTESCLVNFEGIRLNFCKLDKIPGGTTNSMLSKSLMSSSMEMAEEIVSQEKYDGLETIARLIDSVIRRFKVSVRDTVVKFILPKKSAIGQEIELRIGRIHIEEEEISLNTSGPEKSTTQQASSGDTKYMALSDVMTKNIMVEGIELRVNDILITKLYGKHTFKFRFDNISSSVNIEAFLGSYIFAILTSDQLGVLRDFFNFDTSHSSDNLSPTANGGRMMSSEDVRQIQAALKNKQKNDRMTGSLARAQWTTSNLLDGSDDEDETETVDSHTESDDDKFKPFSTHEDDAKASTEQTANKLTCSLKVPGLMLCIVADEDDDDDGNRPLFDQMPMIDSLQNFIGINQFLNDTLHDYAHIRVMASNLWTEFANDVLSYSCINLTVYEYHNEQLSPILLVKDVQADGGNEDEDSRPSTTKLAPSVRIRLKGKLIDIKVAPVVLKLDPTIIERHRKLFAMITGNDKSHQINHQLYESSRKRSKSSSMMMLDNLDADGEEDVDELTINIDCPVLEAELLFPIPDLRPDRCECSSLHDEVLLVRLNDLSLRANASAVDVVCNAVNIDLRCPPLKPGGHDHVRPLFSAQSEQKSITLHFSTKAQLQEEVINTAMLLSQVDSMGESFYVHQKENNTPFQVKNALIGGEEVTKVEIVTPGDRAHTSNYLGHNKMTTKMFVYINIPYGDIILEDKTTFELIYNRIVNDLTLWTPFLPKSGRDRCMSMYDGEVRLQIDPSDGGLFENDDTSPHAVPILPSFYSCAPDGSHIEQSIDSVASGDDSYHTIMDTTLTGAAVRASTQNEFMIELEIDNLNLNFHTKAKRMNCAFIQNLVLGLVVAPESDRCVSLTINGGSVVLKSDDKLVLVGNSYLESNVVSQLNLAMEIRRESDQLKKIKLAAQLSHALLLGIDLSLFEDLFHFVSLLDDQIVGYVCPKVVLELHTNISECAISFENLTQRPTLLYVIDVYLTSMVIENTDQTILHFFIQDALLSFKRNNVCCETLKNYIVVVDTGVIDLTLTLSKAGQIELRLSNNVINVKACHDSLAALCIFLSSFAEMITAQASALNRTFQAKPSNEDRVGTAKPVATHHHGGHHQHCDHRHRRANNDIFTRTNVDNREELIADALSEIHNDKIVSDDEDSLEGPSKLEESAFHFIDSDVGVGINLNENRQPIVRILIDDDEELTIHENHFTNTPAKIFPDKKPETIARYLLEQLSLNVMLFGGHDFDDVPSDKLKEQEDACKSETSSLKSKASTLKARSRYDTSSQANYSRSMGGGGGGGGGGSGLMATSMSASMRQPKVRFQGNSVIWENIDLISTGMYAGGGGSLSGGSNDGQPPAVRASSDARLAIIKNAGGSRRKADTKVALTLTKLRVLVDTFEKDHGLVWQFYLKVKNVLLVDQIEGSSINKMLLINDQNNEAVVSVFSIRLLCYRNFQDQNEECDLRVALRPLRINIDQDALIFLMDFFASTNELLSAKFAPKTGDKIGKEDSRSSSKENIPMAEDDDDFGDDDSMFDNARRMKRTESVSSSSSTASPLTSRRRRTSSGSSGSSTCTPCCTGKNSSLSGDLYIKNFVFSPAVPIRLDYKGKHIDFKQGAIPGLFLGLAQLNQSELRLKSLENKHGLLGLDRVLAFALEEWARDIKRNQLPSILGGIGPMHSFIQLFQGIRDLFLMPIDQYRRDQRIVRGLQRGAYTFYISTALATLDLTNRVVGLINMTAQFAHDVVTPPTAGSRQLSRIPASQPRDFREGVAVAYTVMREGFHDTAHNLTSASYASSDMSARIGEVLRQIPSTIVRPLIHVSQATSSVLVGTRNQLTPEARKDDHDKWKNANEQ